MTLKDIKLKIAKYLLKGIEKEAQNTQEISVEDLKQRMRTAFINGLNDFNIVNVLLDPSFPEVDVPEKFKSNKILALQFGRGLANPIKDLLADDNGITATLSFWRTAGVKEYKCYIPWLSVYAIQEGSSSSPPDGGTPVNMLVLDDRERKAA
jgi:hypothetical protein